MKNEKIAWCAVVGIYLRAKEVKRSLILIKFMRVGLKCLHFLKKIDIEIFYQKIGLLFSRGLRPHKNAAENNENKGLCSGEEK